MQKQIVFFSGLLMSLSMTSGFLLGAQDFVCGGEKGQSSQRHSEQESGDVTCMEQDRPIITIDSFCRVRNQEQLDSKEEFLHDCDLETLLTLLSGKTSIKGWACSGNENLTEVIIPSGVASIGDCAFGGCKNLRQITIPSSVVSIGDAAFAGCLNLEKVIIQRIRSWRRLGLELS